MVSFYSFGLGGLLKKLKEEDLIELSSDGLMKIIFEDGLVCDFFKYPLEGVQRIARHCS